jgi:hypothetical protein
MDDTAAPQEAVCTVDDPSYPACGAKREYGTMAAILRGAVSESQLSTLIGLVSGQLCVYSLYHTEVE